MANLSAGLLPKDLLTELDSLLLPVNALNKDVRDLAGYLDFSMVEIQYLCEKRHPFEFLIDQWCKRQGSEATLQVLCNTLEELQRHDAVELVKRAIKEIQCASYEKLQQLVVEQSQRMDKIEATGFVQIYANNCQEESEPSIASEIDDDDKPPTVFISYFPESESHIENVKDLVSKLRSYRIDVKMDIYDELQSAQSKQLYVWSNLQNCDYVLVMCSPSVKLVDKIKDKSIIPKVSDKMKEAIFVIHHIVKDRLHNEKKVLRYVPVLLSGCEVSHIPQILKGPQFYQIPDAFDSLVRRIYNVNEIELPKRKMKYTAAQSYVDV